MNKKLADDPDAILALVSNIGTFFTNNMAKRRK